MLPTLSEHSKNKPGVLTKLYTLIKIYGRRIFYATVKDILNIKTDKWWFTFCLNTFVNVDFLFYDVIVNDEYDSRYKWKNIFTIGALCFIFIFSYSHIHKYFLKRVPQGVVSSNFIEFISECRCRVTCPWRCYLAWESWLQDNPWWFMSRTDESDPQICVYDWDIRLVRTREYGITLMFWPEPNLSNIQIELPWNKDFVACPKIMMLLSRV